MTEKREDVFRKSLGVSNIRTLIRQAQKAFTAWEENTSQNGTRDKTELFNTLGVDFFQLLGGVFYCAFPKAYHKILCRRNRKNW